MNTGFLFRTRRIGVGVYSIFYHHHYRASQCKSFESKCQFCVMMRYFLLSLASYFFIRLKQPKWRLRLSHPIHHQETDLPNGSLSHEHFIEPLLQSSTKPWQFFIKKKNAKEKAHYSITSST